MTTLLKFSEFNLKYYKPYMKKVENKNSIDYTTIT